MKKLFIIAVIGLFCCNYLFADKRSYVWTYEYMTLEKGEKELEHYMTLSSPDLNKMEGQTTTVHQVEFEMGMTSNFDFAFYQVFKQSPIGGLTFDEYKLRARYKIGEKNQYWLDPLIYAEYIGKPDFSQSELEFKLILAKDLGKFNISLNPYVELAKEDGEFEVTPNYAAGIHYSISDLFRVGLEFKGNKEANYFGPVISHGNESAYFCLGSGIAYGTITAGKPEINIRTILGIRL